MAHIFIAIYGLQSGFVSFHLPAEQHYEVSMRFPPSTDAQANLIG